MKKFGEEFSKRVEIYGNDPYTKNDDKERHERELKNALAVLDRANLVVMDVSVMTWLLNMLNTYTSSDWCVFCSSNERSSENKLVHREGCFGVRLQDELKKALFY